MSEQKPANPATKISGTPDCLKFSPATDVGHPPFDLGRLGGEADYAILGQLEGTWVNTDKTGLGIHTTCLPSPGTSNKLSRLVTKRDLRHVFDAEKKYKK